MAPAPALHPPRVCEQRGGPGSTELRNPGRVLYFHTDLFAHFKAEKGRIPLAKDSEGVSVLDLPVLPEGEFEHPWWGTLKWSKGTFADMIRNFQAGIGSAPFLNLDHAGLGFFGDGSAPAAGWITDLWHDEDNALFMAHNELTDLGEEAFGTRRYRYTSAEVEEDYTDSRGQTYKNRLAGLAGTNRPFHETMPGTFGAPAQKTICLSRRGPYTLWTPGEYVGAQEAAALGVPGLSRAPQFQIPFSQLPAGSVVSHSVVVGGTPAAEENAMAPTPTKNGNGAPGAAVAAAKPAAQGAAVEDGVVVTPETEGEDPEVEAGVELEAETDPAVLDNPTDPVVPDTGAGGGEDDGPVTLSRSQLADLQRQAAAGAEANRLLLQAAAENKIGGHVRLGVIPRKKQATALKIALAVPELFDEYFADLPPCLPLARVGVAGDGAPGGAREGGSEPAGGSEETFAGKVAALRRERPGISVTEAMAEVAADHPQLHAAHRAETRGQTSRNGRFGG